MHNFEQVKDVLDYGKKIHADLQSLYSSLNDQKQQTRVKMLLDFLRLHEQHREEALTAFESEAKAHILDTWMQYAPSVNIANLIRSKSVHPEMSMDEVIDLLIEFDNALVELYREAALETDIPQVKEVFENLQNMENNEKLKVVRDAIMLKDI